jgi:hypothetical protein
MSTAAITNRPAVFGPSISLVLASAWPALLLATLCLVPFLNKPFIIDDPHFLEMAQQIVRHPLHPMDFDLCWNTSEDCAKDYLMSPPNPLMGYALVPTVLTGSHEWTAHLTQIAFVWVAVLAMASLVFRLGWDRAHATISALLLVAIPPFLPMASTAMPDTLAATLAVLGIERLAAWKAEHKWSQAVAAALALALAAYARSHLLLLLPLGAFFLLDALDPKQIPVQLRQRWWLWTPIVAGAFLLALIILMARERTPGMEYPAGFRGVSNILPNLRAYLLYFAFPLPLAACWLANRWTIGWRRRIVVVLAVAVLIACIRPHIALSVSCTIIGLAALTDLLLDALRKRDHQAIFFLLWLLIPIPIAYYGHLPIKYLLPCIPALILLCLRLSEGLALQFSRTAAIVLLAASASYSVLILRSDAEFASFGRSAMDGLIRPHVAAGEMVWFPDQFSAYWYAPLDGARLTFPGGPQPKPGDLLVVDLAEGPFPESHFPHRTVVGTISYRYRFGRTMGGGIGLYSNRFGPWLWGFSDSDPVRYELWKID